MDRGLATTQMELLGKVFQMSTCKTCPDKVRFDGFPERIAR